MIKITSFTIIENGNDYGETTDHEKIVSDFAELENYRKEIEIENNVQMIEIKPGKMMKNKIVLFNYEEI